MGLRSPRVAAFAGAMLISACGDTAPVPSRPNAKALPLLVFDGHNDTPEQLRTLFANDFSRFDLAALPPAVLAKTHTDIPHLRAGHVGGIFWSVWVDPELPRDRAVVEVLEQIDTVEQIVARWPGTFALVRTADDAEAAMREGRIASLIGMEGGHSIAGSPAVLRQMYRAGARYMTLAHFKTNDLCDSATDKPRHGGLSALGVGIVREMNRLGMLVDLSHVSEATMNDVLDVARAPVIFSHSNARAVMDHPRNVSDAVLRRVTVNGGIVMVNFVPDYLTCRPRAGISDVADHIDNIRRVAGVDHVGIGSDFGGTDDLPDGLRTVADFPALFALLKQRGWSDADLRKLASGNILRVMRANERAARPGELPAK